MHILSLKPQLRKSVMAIMTPISTLMVSNYILIFYPTRLSPIYKAQRRFKRVTPRKHAGPPGTDLDRFGFSGASFGSQTTRAYPVCFHCSVLSKNGISCTLRAIHPKASEGQNPGLKVYVSHGNKAKLCPQNGDAPFEIIWQMI
jgi:hypothetical protein